MSQLIKEIYISRFRSIGKMQIPVDNVTVFSGKNNSGKSNILKALNLFFNKETSFDTKYEHSTDYNKFFRGMLGGARRVIISIKFHGIGNAALKEDFWITREFGEGIEEQPAYRSTNEKVDERLKKKDGTITRQFTTFYNKINYIYIPAVRDRGFVKHLFQLFENIIRADAAKDKLLTKSIDEISDILQSKSKDISDSFGKFIKLHTSASLSSNMKDILGAVTINVENLQVASKFNHSVDIFSSGDGILMSYIMYFIAYMSLKISNKYYIWGFEEPETALEYSKAQALAETFYNDFAKKAQIFITTHSPAFINLKDKQTNVAFYRVYQNVGKDGRLLTYAKTLMDIQQNLFSYKDDYKLLKEELHMVEQAQEIEKALFHVEKERLQNENRLNELEVLLKQNKHILLTEGKTDAQILKMAWKALYPKKKLPFAIEPRNNCQTVNIDISGKASDSEFDKKVIGLFDNDTAGFSQFNALQKGLFDDVVNKPHLKKSKSNNVYGMLLPIPSDREIYSSDKPAEKKLEIEHYFDDDILKKHAVQTIINYRKDSTGQTLPLYEIGDRKTTFAGKIEADKANISFERFKILFDEILPLFQ